LGTSEVWRTETIKDNVSPQWKDDESQDFVLHDRAQMITVHAFDEDSGRLDPDDDLGLATVRVNELLLAGRTMELALQDTNKHQPTGAFVTLNCEIHEWTTDLTSLEQKGDSNKKVLGLLVVVINRGFNIPVEREKAASFVKVTYADKEFISKQIMDYPGVDALNPSYDSAFEVPITSDMPTKGEKAVVSIHLLNGVLKPTLLGTTTIDFASLEEADHHTITERREIGNQGGSVEYRVSLCGVGAGAGVGVGVQPTEQEGQVKNGDSGHSSRPGASRNNKMLPNNSPRHHEMNRNNGKKLDFGDDEAIGTIRITVVQGRGLKIQEELFNIDVPDVYCQIGFGSSSNVWTTSVIHNTCIPAWNESQEYPLTDHGQFITLDVFDKNEREEDPDVEVGSAKITVGKV
jgi:Ca2+-dependent lipid-binding protein